EGRNLCWRRLGQEVGLSVTGRTIQRTLSRYGYSCCKACKKPFINRQNQRERMRYSCEHWQKPVDFWRKLMYSDECFFDTLKQGSTWVTRLPHKHYHDHCLQHTFHSGRSSVHLWGAISHNWKSP
ncbi:hypothetical protein C7212DRAFT_39087, partial [Tuber magnatum]